MHGEVFLIVIVLLFAILLFFLLLWLYVRYRRRQLQRDETERIRQKPHSKNQRGSKAGSLMLENWIYYIFCFLLSVSPFNFFYPLLLSLHLFLNILPLLHPLALKTFWWVLITRLGDKENMTNYFAIRNCCIISFFLVLLVVWYIVSELEKVAKVMFWLPIYLMGIWLNSVLRIIWLVLRFV